MKANALEDVEEDVRVVREAGHRLLPAAADGAERCQMNDPVGLLLADHASERVELEQIERDGARDRREVAGGAARSMPTIVASGWARAMASTR